MERSLIGNIFRVNNRVTGQRVPRQELHDCKTDALASHVSIDK